MRWMKITFPSYITTITHFFPFYVVQLHKEDGA